MTREIRRKVGNIHAVTGAISAFAIPGCLFFGGIAAAKQGIMWPALLAIYFGLIWIITGIDLHLSKNE
jgi:uncharacterized membrane protein YdbT with pleckstrin-like domain